MTYANNQVNQTSVAKLLDAIFLIVYSKNHDFHSFILKRLCLDDVFRNLIFLMDDQLNELYNLKGLDLKINVKRANLRALQGCSALRALG